MVKVMVVKSYEAITRLRSVAQNAKVPIPAMLAESLAQVGLSFRVAVPPC